MNVGTISCHQIAKNKRIFTASFSSSGRDPFDKNAMYGSIQLRPCPEIATTTDCKSIIWCFKASTNTNQGIKSFEDDARVAKEFA